MPLPGGATDKIGNRYEFWWTLVCLADVMAEQADTIFLEPPGKEGDGVEFILSRTGVRERHQVKRQHSQLGRWSLAALETERVLSRFWASLPDANVQCHFVSTFAADELAELSENARSAGDVDQFLTDFVAKSAARSSSFSRLRQSWNTGSDSDVYEGLKRVFVRTIDEHTLKELAEYRLAVLVDAEATTVAGVLALFIQDHVHQEIRAHDIWQYVGEQGLRRRQWNNDPHVLAQVSEQNARYLNPLRRDVISGTMIPRVEVAPIMQALAADRDKQGVLLSGEAGAGKSGLALQVADAAFERGWPVLAFRVDQLESIRSPRDVGRQLDLPESPVVVLANIAQGQPCLLIVDQLDAISKVSGRNPHFFDGIAELIYQAQVHPNMRVVLLCRKFDIVNDDRLRKLIGQHGVADEIAIGRLDHTIVREEVARLGLAAQLLTERQLDLLSVPLHLKLLSEVAGSNEIRPLDFKTANDLYGQFWRHKHRVLDQRLGRPVAWTEVIDALADHMSAQQRLFAPIALVDQYASDVDAMVSEHVLFLDGPRARFFHETFFDYAFARRFVTAGKGVVSLLLSSEQHLFRRAQVRQILTYSREADFERYLADLREFIFHPHIRFHIKQVVFALLRQLNAPTEDEWNIIRPVLDTPDDPCHGEAWQLLTHVPWFRLATSVGAMQRWLDGGDEARAGQAVRILGIVAREAPNEVVPLLEGRDISEQPWRNRMIYVVSCAELSKSRRVFNLFLRLIRDGAADGSSHPAGTGDFWLVVYSLAEANPAWYCEVMGAYFGHHLARNLAAGVTNPFAPQLTMRELRNSDGDNAADNPTPARGTISDTQYDHNFIEVARKAPAAFVEQVFDFVLKVAEFNAKREGAPPYRDSVWPWRLYGGGHGISETLLTSMEAALHELASEDPDQFVPYATRLRASECETAQYLLVRAYAANGQRFADDAAAYLCERPERLRTGWSDEVHWATRQLLEAISPYCSPAWLGQLEIVVMNYYTDYERSARSYRKGYGTLFGDSQLVLLNGIDPARRSQRANRRLEEWRRKFQRVDGFPPQGMRGGFVGSPLPPKACEHMNDLQWLMAMAAYSSDLGRPDRDFLAGGAPQLAQQLVNQVKRNPQRFARLVSYFPDTTNVAYFEAVLQGLSEVTTDIELALAVCRRFHALPDHPCGRAILRLISKLAGQTLPDELLAMVRWYATEARDPAPREDIGRAPVRSELEFDGINSVRGGAAITIADLMFADPGLVSYFSTTLEQMGEDPSDAVRTCVAVALTAVLNRDRDLSVQLFRRLTEGSDALLGTGYVDRYLYYALHTHFEQLRPTLERMLASEDEQVVDAGARHVCIASLYLLEAIPLVRICLQGRPALRIAAAKVFGHNVATASNRAFCQEKLITLFNDENEEVRKESGNCFHAFKDAALEDFTPLVEAFVHSRAFGDGSFFLLHALEETTAHLPDVTCLVCERFTEDTDRDAGSSGGRGMGDVTTVSKLVVRTYEQSNSKDIQSRCLTVIDRLAQASSVELFQSLSLLDR